MRELFKHYVGQTSKQPMMLDVKRAQGIYIIDQLGNSYADMTSGICVSSLGHSHPSVVKAINDQAGQYLHTMVYGEHIQAPQVQLAYQLAKLLPDQLDCVFYTNSGSEATEGAIKLSRKALGRTEIIACRNGYHGSTIGAMSLMSDPMMTLAYQPSLSGIRFIDFNDVAHIDLISDRTAAVILEPIQGPAGVRLPDSTYLQALRNACDRTNTLLVFDEIQCGMGRTGSMFAFEQYGVVPDILLLAKALGGGLPLGAMVASKSLLDEFADDPPLGYISTFGGHPLCCAAGLAALNHLIENPSLIQNVSQKADLIRSYLTSNRIVEVRSAGLLMAVDLGGSNKVDLAIDRCREQGVLIDHFLFDPNSFRIAPPLNITDIEIKKYIEIINEVVDGL